MTEPEDDQATPPKRSSLFRRMFGLPAVPPDNLFGRTPPSPDAQGGSADPAVPGGAEGVPEAPVAAPSASASAGDHLESAHEPPAAILAPGAPDHDADPLHELPPPADEPQHVPPPVVPGEPALPVALVPSDPAPSGPDVVTNEASAGKEKTSWWSRLRTGLSRSSTSIGGGIADIFTKRKLDAAMLEELEDVLIRADLGIATATRITEAVGRGRYDRSVAPDEVKSILATEVERVLAPCAKPIEIGTSKPFVILVVGVNGSGKTTTIGKLAAKLAGEGRTVMLAAGDTFRAAAIAQLGIWGERLGCPVVAREPGSDAAGLAFEAIERARAAGSDVLLMDTAGRLQNRTELMAELEKIIRVMRKLDATAPHAVLLVLDATVGQNAMSQVEIFGKVAGVTGLVMTKLDGTARGGILVAIADKFKLPVHFIGVGETAEDLEPFTARDFAAAIAGLERSDAIGR